MLEGVGAPLAYSLSISIAPSAHFADTQEVTFKEAGPIPPRKRHLEQANNAAAGLRGSGAPRPGQHHLSQIQDKEKGTLPRGSPESVAHKTSQTDRELSICSDQPDSPARFTGAA